MGRETRVRYGTVPHALGGKSLPELSWCFEGDEFLLRRTGDHYFFYRKGEGITVERGEGAEADEEALWLAGSVYSAVASLNGLLPIHASAVAHEGAVFAFSGPTGAGKSTLVAALGQLGLPMFCDDTLLLEPLGPDRVVCLPGHKRLKLGPDAIELTGASAREKVSPAVDKFFADPPAGDVAVALPLAEIFFLADGPEPAITAMEGTDRFTALQDDHYTTQLYAAAQRFGPAERFGHFAQLARRIPMSLFRRPRDRSRFDKGVWLLAEYIRMSR